MILLLSLSLNLNSVKTKHTNNICKTIIIIIDYSRSIYIRQPPRDIFCRNYGNFNVVESTFSGKHLSNMLMLN